MKYELSLAEKYRKGRSEGFSQGEAVGLSKGEAKGIAEEKRRMVRSLREQSVPLEVIAKASSLSMDEISRILDN